LAKKEEKIEMEGTVIEALPGTQFKVRLENGHEILAYPAGKMRRYYIRLLLADGSLTVSKRNGDPRKINNQQPESKL
jgi:translation initiation factor IF-1